jgi:CRP-like cAMP-binding protein
MDARELKDKASALFTKGKFAKAAETYEEYCAVDRKDHQARLRCGDAWAKAGKKDRAAHAYSTAAEGFARDGFLPRAIAASKLVLEIDPSHKGVQKMLADLYAQKSGGSRPAAAARPTSSPSGVSAVQAAMAGQEPEITRSVSAPIASNFANRKDAIDLDAPVSKPKPSTSARGQAAEVPSPMNRADALELPEYEIPMDDGPSSVGGMSAQKGPSPTSRRDAIEIEVDAAAEVGPRALVETSIDIELSAGQPTTGEVEIPIEGQPLPDAELPVATSFELDVSVPSPSAPSFELEVVPPPSAPSQVFDLTDSIPDPKPSLPVFELTEEVAEAPPPARPSPATIASVPAAATYETPPPPPDLSLDLAAQQAAAELAASEQAAQRAAAEAERAAAERAAAERAAAERAAAERAAAERAAAERAAAERAELAAAENAAALRAAAERAAAERAELAAEENATALRAAAERAAVERAAVERAGLAAAENAAALERSAAVHHASALPPPVGDAGTVPPSIAPALGGEVVAPPAAEGALPPGLKPRKTEPTVPQSSPSSSRIWIPPAFTPAAPRPDAATASASSTPPPPMQSEPSTDLERSLEAFMKFDPDAPVPAATAEPIGKSGSFTELDLEGDSLLHAVEAAAAQPTPAHVEEAMEAPDDPRTDPGALPKIPLFSDLPEDAFIALFEKCPLQRFEQGQLVFEQGDKADAFYVICGGRAQVFRTDQGVRRDIATLEEGSFFGEMALLSEAPRSASVEAASEDTQVLVISAEILKELSAAHPSVSTALKKFCRQRMLSNLMNNAPLFAPFNRNDRRDLVQKFRARDVNKGDVLVKEGQSSDGLYLVLSGEVEVDAGGTRIATLKEGEVFGEMSLLTRSPASASVRATRHTSLLRLPKQDFDLLILSHPQVLEHVSVLVDARKQADVRRKSEMI